MKTILMLIVGLMLAGCGSMENHVRNQGVASTPVQDRGDWIADAHGGDGKRFIVRADQKLTAFLGLESFALRFCYFCESDEHGA